MQSSCYGDRQNSVEGRNVLYIQAMFIWLLLQNHLLHEYSTNNNPVFSSIFKEVQILLFIE